MREKHRYGAFCAGFRGGSTQKCMIFVVGLGLHHHKNSHKMHGSCNKVLITSHWSYSMLLAATPSISRRLDITLGSKHVFLNVCYPGTQIYQEFYREQPLRIHRFNPKSGGNGHQTFDTRVATCVTLGRSVCTIISTFLGLVCLFF